MCGRRESLGTMLWCRGFCTLVHSFYYVAPVRQGHRKQFEGSQAVTCYNYLCCEACLLTLNLATLFDTTFSITDNPCPHASLAPPLSAL